MHPVIAKLKPVVVKIREDRSQKIDVINMHPLDASEIGLKPGESLWGIPVVFDSTRPRTSVTLGVTQETDAFDDRYNRR